MPEEALSPPMLPSLRRILVGYDASESSARALNLALGLARPVGAELWVVHASSAPRIVAEPRTDEEAGQEALAVGETLRQAEFHARELGLQLKVRAEEGAAAAVILAVAAEVGADLIVLGTRGLRGAPRLVLGSVSAAVVSDSIRPVLVVP